MANPLSDALLTPIRQDDSRFMTFPDQTGMTYREFHDRVAQAANVLAARV